MTTDRDAETDIWPQPLPRCGNCGHDKRDHILQQGACRPGFTCPSSCAAYASSKPVKAPGRDGDIFLTRGTVVEVGWSNSGDRLPYYVDEGGYQITAEQVGNGKPYPWGVARIVRVLTEDKPAQEPVLPRRIKPEDVRVGMVVERRKGEAVHRDRVQQIDGDLIMGVIGAYLWMPGYDVIGWTLWLVEDAPEPVDPDAALVERMAEAMWRIEEKPPTDYAGAVDDPEGWQELAEAALLALRETHDVTARAEQ